LGDSAAVTPVLDLGKQHRGGYPVRLRRLDPRQQIRLEGLQLGRPLRPIRISGRHAQVSQVPSHGVAAHA
jgi:hypothetical protein